MTEIEPGLGDQPSFVPVTIKRLAEETAVISGVGIGKPIVALGAHLLKDGAAARTDVQAQAAQQ
jgi:hypothetical protein